jgi:hypothetical protein
MTSLKRLLVLTAAVTAVAAPAASARVAEELPAGSNPPASVQKSDYGSIAAHHDKITQQQWDAAAAAPEVLVDGTSEDGGSFPVGLVILLTIGVPLGIVLMQVVGKSAIRYRRAHRLA